MGEKTDGSDLILVNFEKRVREDEIVDAVHLRICLEFWINIEENLYTDQQIVIMIVRDRKESSSDCSESAQCSSPAYQFAPRGEVSAPQSRSTVFC